MTSCRSVKTPRWPWRCTCKQHFLGAFVVFFFRGTWIFQPTWGQFSKNQKKLTHSSLSSLATKGDFSKVGYWREQISSPCWSIFFLVWLGGIEDFVWGIVWGVSRSFHDAIVTLKLNSKSPWKPWCFGRLSPFLFGFRPIFRGRTVKIFGGVFHF